MIEIPVTVEPYGSLFIGGYAAATGGADADTAADRDGLLIPGSTLKGALREAAWRLVRGREGEGAQLIDALFGAAEAEPGLLRMGPLRPVLDGRTVDPETLPPALRHHVSLDRYRHQAADKLLFQNRVTAALPGLRFAGTIQAPRTLEPEERGLLEAAATIADQLGGGRGRGLGFVALTLGPERPAADGAGPAAPEPSLPTQLFVFEAEEPLHLAAVKDPGNFTPTQDHLDGSSLRGAVAAACGHDAALCERLFGPASPVVFGDARAGGPEAIPAPATLREPKGKGPLGDDAVRLAAAALGGERFCRPEDTRALKGGTVRPEGEGTWKKVAIERRTVTRAARDHASGRAADRLLYTLEVVDPHSPPGRGALAARLRFYAPVSGDREALHEVFRAAAPGLAVGGDRSRGFGRLRLVEVCPPAPLPELAERHRRWVDALRARGAGDPEASGVLLALGPIALRQEALKAALCRHGLALLDGAARRGAHAGWNARAHLPRTVTPQLLPGATLIVRTAAGGPALPALAALEAEGLGPGRPDGWGRLVACHPIHVDLA